VVISHFHILEDRPKSPPIPNALEGQLSSTLYVFFGKSQSNRPETGAYLENTTLLIPIKLGSQGLILRLTGQAIGTKLVVFVPIVCRRVLVYRSALMPVMLTVL
jgi:hypothetical protein